jgi:hypothetical protein
MYGDFEVKPSRLRTITLENGNTLRLEAKDPYGFIHMSLEKGQLPESMTGAFTSWFEAERAAQRYQSQRDMVINEMKIVDDKKKK